MFRHREDRVPVALIATLTALDILVYCLVDQPLLLAGYFLLTIVPKGLVSAFNHHHQHVPTFRRTGLNRALEVMYGLHTGMPTHLWTLHHVLGHHLNYLDQEKDQSRWKRKDGTQMGVLEYAFVTALTAYPRALAVGKRHRRLLAPFIGWSTVTWGIALGLTWMKPMAGALVFLVPMMTCLVYTSWVTYDHHAGLESDSPFEGSFNIMNRWFNLLTGNLGYHTAHHYKQGIHWSRLPALHAEIAHKIPARCYVRSTFDRFLPISEGATELGPCGAADAAE